MIRAWIVAAVSWVVFLIFQAQGIYTGDSGDLVTAASLFGVPHPPGYPLYSAIGWLVSQIPISTISWRVTLLSSFPHAVTVGLTYALTLRLTKKNSLAGVFAAMALSGNYLFFLYSVTPEVFALFDFFIVLLWYLLVCFRETQRHGYLVAACFVLGLSLSHHHIMLFLIPSYAYYVYVAIRPVISKGMLRRLYVWGAICFLFGLLPYAYIPIAARHDAIINWDRAVNVSGFFRLVTRQDYGTFVSGGSFGQTIAERLVAISAYVRFILTDWTWIGVGIAAIGAYGWYSRLRHWFWAWVMGLFCSGPLFFFYASFPLASRFTLGTYERFLLPSYVLLAFAFGAGVTDTLSLLRRVYSTRIAKRTHGIVSVLAVMVFALLPMTIGTMTLWRFSGLREDKTAENLGMDMLSGVPSNAVLLIGQDTALFTIQYVRYVLGVRNDTAVIHVARLSMPDYQTVIKKHFPDLSYPKVQTPEYLSVFIKSNVESGRAIMSNTILPVGDGWYWVPRGILYEAVPSHALPVPQEMYRVASMHVSQFHNPKAGILGRYSHLMLSDVLDVYASGAIALGKTLIRADMWDEAEREFRRASGYNGDTSAVESFELLGVTLLHKKDCHGALRAFADARARSFVADSSLLRLESITYGECMGDTKRADELFSEYEKLKRKEDRPLETL